MNEDDTGRRHVAVGQTHAAAVRSFGELFEDLVVTSYDEASARLLAGAGTVALGAGPGQEALLAELLGGPATVLVQAGSPDERAALARVLAAHGSGIAGVLPASAGSVLQVGPAGDGVVSGDAVAVVLDAAVSVAAPFWPDATPARTDDRSVEPVTPPSAAAGPAAPPRPQVDRRRQLRLAATAAVAALVLAAVLTAIGLTDLGADGVVVGLLVVLGAGQVLVLRELQAVRRDVDAERALAHRFRVRVNNRFDKVIKHGLGARQGRINHGKRLVRLEEAAAREAAHQEYVVELGRVLTRRLDDLADREG